MQLRISQINRRVLRAGPGMFAGAAMRALLDQAAPADWLLLFRQASGYVVTSLEALQRRLRDDSQLLSRRLSDLELPTSPALELDSTLEQAEAQAQRTGYAVIERAGETYGVVSPPHLALGQPNLERLRDLLAEWQPPKGPGVLSDGEVISRDLSPAPQLETLPQRNDRYVNTDFAGAAAPGQPLDRKQPLQQGQAYYFRVHVGEAEASSIEAAPALLPAQLLRETVDLRVVIFSEDFGLSEDTGVLRVPTDGPASVAEPASTPAGIAAGDPLLSERLFFLVRVPGGKRGVCSLRVNIYRNSMLVQSRLVRARVGAGRPLAENGAQLLSALDYNLSPALTPGHLGAVAPHKLSLMLNADDEGNQAFRLVGQEGQELFSNSAPLPAGLIGDLLSQARGALRRAAWGSDAEWDGTASYRYEPSAAAAKLAGQLTSDLGDLAAAGARIYAAIKDNLGRGKHGAEQLRALMRTPGAVQMASKLDASDIVPIALIYDYKIDSQDIRGLCPQFEQSLAKVQQTGGSLADQPCFKGDCPSRDNLNLVCPSGFWGFRHDIGVPTPTPYGPPVSLTIPYHDQPLIDLATYADFEQLGPHLRWFGTLAATVKRESDRAAVISLLTSTEPQLVYFYCHGVLQGTRPSLKVGSKANPGYLTYDNWSNLGIEWPEARPLVFVNGCHTTAIGPDQALNLVRALVQQAEAAGVIGTEITIFEPLAQGFAQALLPLFLNGVPLGRAVREARLALLAQRNPLGLVYTPHAYAELKLQKV